MNKLIGIVGFIGAGKDTAGQALIDNFGFKKDSFAKSLKDVCASVFSWDRDLVDGTTAESRAWREEVDEFWAKELNIPNFSPRLALQLIGTEVFRDNFNQDTWLLSVKARIAKNDNNVVLTDCRFENEIRMIKDMGGSIIRVKRGEDPDWMNLAKNKEYAKLDEMRIHASEYNWVGMYNDIDFEITNDSTIEDLQENMLDLYSKIR